MLEAIVQTVSNIYEKYYQYWIHLKSYVFIRVILIALSFTTIFDILTDYLALYEFSHDGQKWWTGICLAALYYSNRLGLYRWARASYRMRDYRMFAEMTEMKLDWTLLVHGTPILGPLMDMFCLHHKGWDTRADTVWEAVQLCIETELVLSLFSWFYVILVFYEICQLTPIYWENLSDNSAASPPPDLIVIPALEIFEALPQISIQFRAYYDPEFKMDSDIFTLSAMFSIIGLLKATIVFIHYYPSLREGVFKVYTDLDFSSRQFTNFPAVDGDLDIVKELFLGSNPELDIFSIPPMPALQRLRLNSCNINSLAPKADVVISLSEVSKFAGNSGHRNVSSLSTRRMCFSVRFPSLKRLDLAGNFGLDTDTIPTMPLLNTLVLTNCGLVTLGIKSWNERFPRLELLELNNNPRLRSLEKLGSVRKANKTMLGLDKEQTTLPGFQMEKYGEPEIIKEYRIDREQDFSEISDSVAVLRMKL